MYLTNIQILRGLAASWVVLFHTVDLVKNVTKSNSPLIDFLGRYGYFGVDVFFFISGFVIFHSTFGKGLTTASFLRRRLERILPPYLIFTLAYLAIWLVAPGLASKPITPELVVASLFFVSFCLNATPLITVGWTIELEMLFYLFAATTLYSGARHFEKLPTYLAILVIIGGAGLHFTDNPAFLFITSHRLLEFAMGFMLASYFTTGKLDRGNFAAVGFAACAVLLSHQNFNLLYKAVPIGVLMFYAIKWDARTRLPAALEKILKELGDASYSIYLIQTFTLPVAGLLIHKLAPGISATALGIAAVAITLGSGWTFYRLIERNMLAMLRKTLEKPRRVAEATAAAAPPP